MYSFTIYSLGNKIEKSFADLEQRYQTLLGPYAKTEHQRRPLKKNLPPEKLIEQEGQVMLQQFSTASLQVVLSEEGKSFDSKAFAGWIEQKTAEKGPALQFFIGSFYGIDAKVKQQADLLLSLSRFTLPHNLVLVVLLEQLYRAMTILHHKPYHY